MNQLVTVGITTFRRPELLRKALNSVVQQSHKELQIIVIDDASGDSTPSVVASFDDERIEFIQHDDSEGAIVGRNEALQRARGKYVAYLDDDDAWVDTKIEQQVSVAERGAQNVAVISCGGTLVNEHGQVLGNLLPGLTGSMRDSIVSGSLVTVPSAHLFRTEALREVEGYDGTLASHNEHDIWMTLADNNYTSDFVPEYLVEVGSHSGYRMTSDVKLRVDAVEAYFDKWYSTLESWMGASKALSFQRTFTSRVVAGVGNQSLRQGSFAQALSAYKVLLVRYPARLTTYQLIATGMASVTFEKTPLLPSPTTIKRWFRA
jgi:glycosyltransferase involved in cell wall biosynthesis